MIDRYDLACRDGKTMNEFFIGGGDCALHRRDLLFVPCISVCVAGARIWWLAEHLPCEQQDTANQG